jgi:hypothetical protein
MRRPYRTAFELGGFPHFAGSASFASMLGPSADE